MATKVDYTRWFCARNGQSNAPSPDPYRPVAGAGRRTMSRNSRRHAADDACSPVADNEACHARMPTRAGRTPGAARPTGRAGGRS